MEVWKAGVEINEEVALVVKASRNSERKLVSVRIGEMARFELPIYGLEKNPPML
jgi:uncharacterized protein involved in tolerance to divalent cations